MDALADNIAECGYYRPLARKAVHTLKSFGFDHQREVGFARAIVA